MSAAEAATSVKGTLNGLDAGHGAAQASGQAASSLQQNASAAADAATATAPNISGAGDAMAGAVSILGQTESLFSWSGYFQALAVLFLIIAALFAALWFLRRKGGIKLLTGQGDLFVESRIPLGHKKQLILVRFLNKRVLLGVTDQQITMLTELPIDEDHTAHQSQTLANAADFKTHFARAAQMDLGGPG